MKNSLILKVFLLIIFTLVLVLIFYFRNIFFSKNEIDNSFLEKERIEFKDHEKTIKELESFKKPTSELEIPYSENTIDTSIKTDAEIKAELDNFKINTSTSNKNNTQQELNLTDEEILRLLNNTNLAN